MQNIWITSLTFLELIYITRVVSNSFGQISGVIFPHQIKEKFFPSVCDGKHVRFRGTSQQLVALSLLHFGLWWYLKVLEYSCTIENEETLWQSICYACQNNSKPHKDVWNCVTAHDHTCPCIHYEIVWQHMITRVHAYIMKLCDSKWSHVSMHTLWNCVTAHDHTCPCIH